MSALQISPSVITLAIIHDSGTPVKGFCFTNLFFPEFHKKGRKSTFLLGFAGFSDLCYSIYFLLIGLMLRLKHFLCHFIDFLIHCLIYTRDTREIQAMGGAWNKIKLTTVSAKLIC